MPGNAYNEVPYITAPLSSTHPDRLRSVAMLFGMTPAPVTACRVLEIGCGSGGNLIPMAYRLPGSRFSGIDLAEAAIAEGRRAAAEIGLENLDLIAMDLRDIGPPMGEFDYIIAHGLYSWIPDDLRDGLLSVCRERLAPEGVAFVSYNVLPGRYVRMMLRDMMLYHTRNCADPRERLERARTLLGKVGEARMTAASWQPMLDDEIGQSLAGNDGWLYHDDLGPVNDAFHVRDFVARAERHSLQYLGDAQPHLMFDSRASLDWVGGDLLEREQYFDFLCLRPFRQTLLCASEVRLERPAVAERMDRFWFSSPARQSDRQIEGLNSVCLADAPEAVRRVALAMGAVYPRPVAFDGLLELVEGREALRHILFALISSGFAAFHSYGRAAAGHIGPRLKATRLTRWESSHTNVVSYSNHTANRLDGLVRALVGLLDGTREIDDVASALARVEGAPPLADIRERLPGVLRHMLQSGLLEEP